MNFPFPPTREQRARNARLLIADWQRGDRLMRYFIVSQFASGLLSLGCSGASFVALYLGLPQALFWLLTGAGACLAHSILTWRLLRRRYQVQFAFL